MPIRLTARTARSIRILGAALLLPVFVGTGCGAGFDAQTNQPYQAAEGANGDSGSIAARNVLVIADEDGRGTLYAALVNTGDSADRLTSITVDDSAAGVSVSGVRSTQLPPGQSVKLGEGGREITVTGAEPGRIVKLTLNFAEAAPITAQVPVLAEDHYSPSPRPAEDH